MTAPPAPSSAPASSTTAGPTSSSPSTGPTAAEVAAAVEPGLAGSPGTVSAEFRDLATGEVLYARDADEPVAPASSLKVLASAAVVSALGPETTLQTTV
ncbi:D-alanyl-D-alanine carboxypeptidase, partial [Nocardia farcinica]|uniref:D-alanyl-D-alanine carboxypeptidase n=1 Tax=Nocardia farcinica TaxID=37329 RepID=UPI002B4B5257